jgi:hypothetical protein
MEQMNTNKKNEYYSSEDTVKVKIGEKLTWKRVVAFFDRCLCYHYITATKNTTVVINEIMKKNTNKHLSKKATTRFHVNFSPIFTFTVSSEE